MVGLHGFPPGLFIQTVWRNGSSNNDALVARCGTAQAQNVFAFLRVGNIGAKKLLAGTDG
jgi:hypothetical protein